MIRKEFKNVGSKRYGTSQPVRKFHEFSNGEDALPVGFLPFGIQVNIDKDGRLYFIDHASKYVWNYRVTCRKTTFDPPRPATCSPMNKVSFHQLGGINAVLVALFRYSNNPSIRSVKDWRDEQGDRKSPRNLIDWQSQSIKFLGDFLSPCSSLNIPWMV